MNDNFLGANIYPDCAYLYARIKEDRENTLLTRFAYCEPKTNQHIRSEVLHYLQAEKFPFAFNDLVITRFDGYDFERSVIRLAEEG